MNNGTDRKSKIQRLEQLATTLKRDKPILSRLKKIVEDAEDEVKNLMASLDTIYIETESKTIMLAKTERNMLNQKLLKIKYPDAHTNCMGLVPVTSVIVNDKE